MHWGRSKAAQGKGGRKEGHRRAALMKTQTWPPCSKLEANYWKANDNPTKIVTRVWKPFRLRWKPDSLAAQVTFTLFSEPIKWVVVSNLLSFGTCELVFKSVAKFLQKKIKEPFKTTADLFFFYKTPVKFMKTKSSRFMKTKKWTSKSEASWEICARPVKQPNRQQLP